jgi:hypothetical protein
MVNITKAAQDFFDTEEGSSALLPDTCGVDYLDIDIVDFTDQDVSNLFGGKYVAVYIIKDTAPQSDETLKRSYYDKGINSSLFYPEHIREKLKSHYGEQVQYINNGLGKLISLFDYELLSDEDKAECIEYEDKTTNYTVHSTTSLEKMWDPLTSEEIKDILTFTRDVVDQNIEKLFRMETSIERPYAVNVFNDSMSSFMMTFATYEECQQLLEKIHTDKIKTLTNDMAFLL